jgi:hypothetical protein
MKKLLFIVFFIVSCVYFPQAQIQQGDWYYIIDGDTCTDFEPANFKPPYFKGGLDKIPLWIYNRISYLTEARRVGIRGIIVYVRFTVNEDGTVCCPDILYCSNPIFNEQVIKVIMKMPKWIPARACGQTVKMKFILPIRF